MPKSPKLNIINVPGFVVEPDDLNDRRVLVNDPDRDNDIEEKTVIRIGQYVGDLSSGKVGSTTHPNKYKLDRDGVETSTHNKQTGRPLTLGATTNTNFHADRRLIAGTSLDKELQEPDPGQIGFGDTWQRGETNEPGRVDGHDLIREAESATSPVKLITSAILSNNRFSSDRQLNATVTAGGRSEPENGFNPSIRLPDPNARSQSLGSYNRSVKDTTFNNLAKIGTILSLRGTGEVGSNSDNYNPLSFGAEAKAILPSPTQLGVSRPEWETLSAGDVIRRMSQNDIDDKTLTDIAPYSWGVMNNVYDPFDGISATGMPILAFTLILTMLAATELISALVELISPGKPVNAPTLHTSGRHVFGKWKTELPGKAPAGSSFGPTLNFDFPPPIGEILGIQETENSFGDSLRKGTFLFFGIERDLSSVVGAAVGAAAASFGLGGLVEENPSAPGYNAVFCRAILRSTITIINSFKKLGDSPNFISGVKNFLAIFEVIKNSKLISAINIFTSVGDRALSRTEAHEVSADGLFYNSEVDSVADDSPTAAITKSKLKGSNKLAWAGNRTPSSFLLPSTVFGMSTLIALTGKGKGYGNPSSMVLPNEAMSKHRVAIIEPQSPDSAAATESRIPQTTTDVDAISVEKIEAALEAEYVPFYFHDMRTNEITSFHAFLNSLTEDFSPAWETSDGYGRVDQIAIYKSTGRKINLSFWVISTGHADFNDMWVKLNKLVTLVYPQYSQGRKLNPENWQFTMPFSQVMTSSPIIRLRVGDLVRSNYSRFNLSRVFGLTDKGTKLGKDNEIDLSVNRAKLETALNLIRVLRKKPWLLTYRRFAIKNDGANVSSEQGASISVPIPMVGASGEPAAAPMKLPAALLPYYKLTPHGPFSINGDTASIGISTGATSSDDISDELSGIFSMDSMSVTEIVENYGINGNEAVKLVSQMKLYELSGKNNQKTKDRKFIIPTSWVDLLPTEKLDIIQEQNITTAGEGAITAIADFMLPSKNAIVKSFEETGGMGLACRIDSMSFDWMDQVVWNTTTQGEKAPKRVKVTMSVTAIHDISPGLDHTGYNRAPIWPVGPMNTKINRE